jgi:carbamoylphosphate synthase small subunit
MGNQLVGLAANAKTYKLPFGNRYFKIIYKFKI